MPFIHLEEYTSSTRVVMLASPDEADKAGEI